MTDTPQLIRTLEDSGLERRAADAIASALEEQRRRASGGAPPWVLILATGLVAGSIGFLAMVSIENREGLARVEQGQRELVRRVGILEGGQQELERGQQELERGQQEILRLLRQQ